MWSTTQAAATMARDGVTDERQEPHEREERLARDGTRAERPVEDEGGERLGRRRETEVGLAIVDMMADERIQEGNALATLFRGRSVWMRRISVRAAVSAESQTSHEIRAAAFTRARRLRSFFFRPAVRYWPRRRRRLVALPT